MASPSRSGSEARMLRPFVAAAQRPYIPILVASNRPVELQGGQPAEHFRDRKLKLPGDFRGVQSQNVREVGKDAIPLLTEAKTEALGRGQAAVTALAAELRGHQHGTGGRGEA